MSYQHNEIDKKWQEQWKKQSAFKCENQSRHGADARGELINNKNGDDNIDDNINEASVLRFRFWWSGLHKDNVSERL